MPGDHLTPHPLLFHGSIDKTPCLSNDSFRELQLLQKPDRILGIGDPWVQAVVKDLGQLRIFDKMEREKARPQQVLQFDVVGSHEHLRVRTQRLKNRFAGGDPLRCNLWMRLTVLRG